MYLCALILSKTKKIKEQKYYGKRFEEDIKGECGFGKDRFFPPECNCW